MRITARLQLLALGAVVIAVLALAYFDGGRPWRTVFAPLVVAALIAVGLPVDAEMADTPVKADVLIGHDGLARAIRFVR